jgi:hypothetical protein
MTFWQPDLFYFSKSNDPLVFDFLPQQNTMIIFLSKSLFPPLHSILQQNTMIVFLTLISELMDLFVTSQQPISQATWLKAIPYCNTVTFANNEGQLCF